MLFLESVLQGKLERRHMADLNLNKQNKQKRLTIAKSQDNVETAVQ